MGRQLSRRKVLAGMAATAFSGSALTGCGGGSPEKDEDGRVIVKFWHSMRGSNGEALQEYIEEFNDSQSEIFIDATVQGMYEEAYTKLLQVVGTPDAPDLMQLSSGHTRPTIDAQMLTPMQQFVDDTEFDLSAFLPSVRGPYVIDDQLQLMPQAASTTVVFYNVDAFREAGLDPEKPLTTFEEFVSAARTLKSKAGMKEGASIQINGFIFDSLMGNQGEIVLDNGNGRDARAEAATFNSDAGVETMTWMRDMYDDQLIGNYGRAFDDMRQPWYTQDVAMIMDTTAATIIHENEADFELNSMPVPVPTGLEPAGTPVGGASLGIFADSPEETQQQAFEFVKFLVSPEIQARWAAATGYFPVTSEAYDVDVLADAMKDIPALASANEKALEGGETVGSLVALTGVPTDSYIADAWEAVYDGGDPKTELDKAAEQVTSALKTYNEANPN